ncbi:hypothetical protein GCM10009647_076540 [Streptomyces sanglieri]|uniref:Uncharacterized protein n=1 Tax=Streptomyces sanglieri TaxID=193460 RepID=A0ABW2WQS0_9ACTN
MSEQAVTYVRRLTIADQRAKQVLVLLAERTEIRSAPRDAEIPEIMGLELSPADIPGLAARVGLDHEGFRAQLRGLKQHVRMDVLEHGDGVWEIVYGPSYTDRQLTAPRPSVVSEGNVDGLHAFWLPGWDRYSTWGYEEGLDHYYARIIHNSDDRDAEPRIWITPPRYVARTIDELAQAVAEAIAPYEPIPMPASIIKMYMTKPPASR